MAKTDTQNLMKLPADIREKLEKLTPDIAEAESAVNALKKLGVDVRQIEDKLNWAIEVRETLLKEFR